MRSEINEYEKVEKAAEKFVKSVALGNGEYAKQLFVDEAVLFGYLDGDLEHGSIQQFYDNVDSVAVGDEFNARIDVLLVEQGFFSSRERAKAALMEGVVFVDGERIDKAGTKISEEAEITVKGEECPYVSRGGYKLAGALQAFGQNGRNRITRISN